VKPKFFRDAAAFRTWLSTHHDTASELLVGFHRVDTGKPSITYPEALDEALCLGWIDGIRKRFDESSYTVRFTPRRPKSNWSRVNIDRVAVLTGAGRMLPSGVEAFKRRDEAKSNALHEARARGLDEASEAQLRAEPRAWAFFQAQSAWFQRNAGFWVASAKREDTRARRLARLIDHMRNERTLPELALPPRKTRRVR
jgi:uncharacterized protein YdeI (YjbR/CyaY-like superfamily)